MIKVFSKQFGGEVLVNETRILYVTEAVDNSAILHFDAGQVLAVTQSYKELSKMLLPKVKADSDDSAKLITEKSSIEKNKVDNTK